MFMHTDDSLPHPLSLSLYLSLSLSLFLSPLSSLSPLTPTCSQAPTLPSIAVTYRQPPEQFNPSANRHHHQLQPQQQPHPRSPITGPRDKDRLHTLNRSIRALLNVRRGPRSSNGHHHRASANLDKDSAATSVSNSKSPSFQSYLNLQHQEREREMEGESVSPRGSPQTRRRRPNPHRNEVHYYKCQYLEISTFFLHDSNYNFIAYVHGMLYAITKLFICNVTDHIGGGR